jgi:hypothetical protein
MNLQAVLEGFQETDVVMVGIQARQAEVPTGHGEWLEQLQKQELATSAGWRSTNRQWLSSMTDSTPRFPPSTIACGTVEATAGNKRFSSVSWMKPISDCL